MFNPNDLELCRHITAAQSQMRELDMLIRERREKDLFLTLMVAEKALVYAQERLNRMKFGGK